MRKRKVISLAASLLVLVGIFGAFTDKSDADVTTAAPAAGAAPGRCLSVPGGLVKAIASGLTVKGHGTLRLARAVRSRDYKRVYFVSAEIDRPGMKGRG